MAVAQDWESDVLAEGEDGLIIFDGGTFSRGPHHLLGPDEEEEQEPEAPETSVSQRAFVSSTPCIPNFDFYPSAHEQKP